MEWAGERMGGVQGATRTCGSTAWVGRLWLDASDTSGRLWLDTSEWGSTGAGRLDTAELGRPFTRTATWGRTAAVDGGFELGL